MRKLYICIKYFNPIRSSSSVPLVKRIFQSVSAETNSPSLLLSLAKPGAWLLDNCVELLKDDGGRLDTSGLSHTSENQ